MIQRVFHYCASLTFLLALSVIYQNLVAPLMQPPDFDAVNLQMVSAVKSDNNLQDLFSKGSWQHGECKKLQTPTGTLLFLNSKQVSQDQWKLWPVTLIIGRGMSTEQNESPVIIEAEQGAEIKFARSLDVMGGESPPFSRGRILGEVHVFREDATDPERRFDLKTANVGIDNKKLWTTEAIEMNVGQAQWMGRDLTLHFVASTDTSTSRGSDILDRMELIYLDQFSMPIRSGGLWQRDAYSSEQAPSTSSDRAAMVSLQCDGRVEYDFALDQLLVNDSVSLVHQVKGELPDRFDCDWLQLTLNDPTNRRIDRANPLDWLVGIIASGSPAVANLPSFDSELAAERIDFDAVKGIIRADGRQGIRLRRGVVTARLSKLIYQFDPQIPEAILSIDAPGAGRIEIDDSTIALRKAVWQDGFRIWPVESSLTRSLDTDVQLRMEGDIHATLSDGGEFRANSIAGILKPERQQLPATGNTLVPDRFEVIGDVQIDTTALAAETDRLLLFFVSEPDPPGQSARDSATPSPLRQWVAQPGGERQQVDPVARPRPSIRGDLISAQLRRNQSGLNAKKLSVIGGVEVTHQFQMNAQVVPARLTGEHFQLIDGGGEDVLQLGSGVKSPARFQLGDGFFVGPQIQIRPNDNVVWINAAGEFQVPTAVLPSVSQGDGNLGQPEDQIRWVKPPYCRWQGEMIFDGRTAILSDGVEIAAELIQNRQQWDLKMNGDRLQVDLIADVELRDVQSLRTAQMQQVALLGTSTRPVFVQAQRTAPDGLREAKHLIHAERLVLTPVDGLKLVGAGPGWYRGWQRGVQGNALLPNTGVQAGQQIGTDRTLTGIHLTFNDSLRADATLRNVEFVSGVRVGTKTLTGWDESFDAYQMDAISEGESTLDCDRLRFSVDPAFSRAAGSSGSRPWEMEAISGVVFRTRNERGLLEGTASRASYSSVKDLFTVLGAPNQAALFRQTLPDGSAGPEGAVRSMTIRPKSMKVESAVVERLNMASPNTLP